MRRFSVLFCLLSLLCLPTFAQGNEPHAKKHYCDADQIKVTDSMILVDLQEGVFEIDALEVDQGGIYFNADTLRCIHCRKTINPRNICECPKHL